MKGVIPTPDIAKKFHPTPDIKAKNARHRHSKFTPTLDTHLSKDGKIQKTFPKWEPKSFVPLAQFFIWNSPYPKMFAPSAQLSPSVYFSLYVC